MIRKPRATAKSLISLECRGVGRQNPPGPAGAVRQNLPWDRGHDVYVLLNLLPLAACLDGAGPQDMRTSKRSSLIHLIYFSRAQLSADPAARLRQINEIARHAQKKNEFSVITSLLIVDQGYFIQILEGERMSVQDTFQRIGGDSATATCTSSSGARSPSASS